MDEQKWGTLKAIRKTFTTMNTNNLKDRIQGALIGGAIGDALGYPVEFMRYEAILEKYGRSGICQHEIDPHSGKAIVSDDTQMTLFTANALLFWITRGNMHGIAPTINECIKMAYLEWLETQKGVEDYNEYHTCWIRDIKAINIQRAPGITCISALQSIKNHQRVHNNSKGCGGVMRVAPIGLFAAAINAKEGRKLNTTEVAQWGGDAAAITHQHPLGYLSAAFLSTFIFGITTCEEPLSKERLTRLIHETYENINNVYPTERRHTEELISLINQAIRLANNEMEDVTAISTLGEGWVGEEALAIAIYCALKYHDDFKKAIIASVNHSGDSDSTGAICGNICGAIVGYKKIPYIFHEDLELHDVMIALADDLTQVCIVNEYAPNDTPEECQWISRYVHAFPTGLPELELTHQKVLYYIPLYTESPTLNQKEKEWLLGQTNHECFFFNHPDAKYGQEAMLSIWDYRHITIENTNYWSVGQFMQAEKARIFYDMESRKKILASPNKEEILRLGKNIRGFDATIWNKYCYAVSLFGNYHKFYQNRECLHALLNTGNRILVKDSTYDKIWGVGLSRQDDAIKNPQLWKGENILGFALMRIRHIMKYQQAFN